SGPDVLQMEVRLIERPLGDPYLNHDLWKLADEHVVDPARRGVLEENGFQVALLGGIPPAEFQTLLASERSCANPRLLVFHACDSRTLILGPTQPDCHFEIEQDGQLTLAELGQAQCSLLVVPTLSKDGSILLRFTPRVKHGSTAWAIRPAP